MNKVVKTCLQILCLMSLVQCTSAGRSNESDDSTKNEEIVFVKDKIASGNVELQYQAGRIHTDPATPASLVIYLHGGSSKGSDNQIQMQEPAVTMIKDYLVDHNINSIFIVPQCPSNLSWGGTMNNVLKQLIDRYVSNGEVDDGRLYILGGSMGGTGIWSMVSAYPELFAAAMPVAGNPATADAVKVSSTPIYTVMGTADNIMSIAVVEAFVTKLRANNANVIFDVETGWDHGYTCENSYTDNRLGWVFANKR